MARAAPKLRPRALAGVDKSPFGCAACSGTGWIEPERGRGVTECKCHIAWLEQKRVMKIPYKHRHIRELTIKQLKARPECHADQAKAVAAIKKAPAASFLFCGNTGTGKSGLCWALYREALRQRREAFAFTLTDLLDGFHQYEIGKADEPPLKLDWFKHEPHGDHDRMLLFLDEVADRNPSSFRTSKFKLILEAVTQYGHQLICTSNNPINPDYAVNGKPLTTLEELWSTSNQQDGEPIVRRLIEGSEHDVPTYFEFY
jgi:hypothetical protein